MDTAPKAIPDTLYRYQGDIETIRDILQQRRLWFANPQTLNDPFECRPHIIFSRASTLTRAEAVVIVKNQGPPGLTLEQFNAEVDNLMVRSRDPATRDQYQAVFRIHLMEHFQGVSLKSFSETPTSMQQWAYYGNSYKGICLGFDLRKPWIYTMRNGAQAGTGVYEVTYAQEYPQVDGDVEFDDPTAMDSWFRPSLLTKAESWRHECEWRAVRANCAPGYQTFPSESLTKIVLGRRMSGEQREEIMELVRAYAGAIEVRTIKEVPQRFELQIVET